ncbi:MAG: hypothetical protein K8F91_17915, partial [Candidatus Obscuribacterales bacterium]|nr:hypothetical protein [Candidatus Obscuribacterales bacterium]
ASKARGCTVELPWRNKRTKVHYSLTVRVDLPGGDPVWTLYEGEGGGSRVVWSSAFEDVDLLYDVLTLSIPEEVSTNLKNEQWQVESAKPSSAKPSREVSASSAEKPPGYYESGLLKEEDLEYYKKRDAVVEEKPDGQDIQPAAKDSKPPQAAEPQPTGVYPQQGDPQSSGAYPQPGAYPPPYPHPGMPYGSGAYPIPPGYGYPPGYQQQYPQQYPPGYQQQYPPQYPPGYQQQYPPGYQQQYPPQYPAGPTSAASTVAVQPGGVPPADVDQSGAVSSTASSTDNEKVRPNVKLGQFLVESGIVPQLTVDAALQLQDLVRTGALPTSKAAEAVRRAHVRGGQVDPALTSSGRATESIKNIAPPLGQILVEAAILRGPILRKALYLQQKVRNGAMNREEAIDALCQEVFGIGRETDRAGETH